MSVVDTFLESPTYEGLAKLRKDSILEIGLKLELEVKRAMRKTQLIKIVSEHMVDNDVFEERILDDLETDSPSLSHAQVELEKARIEMEKVRIEAEKEVELEKIRLSKETRSRESEVRRTIREERRDEFDLVQQIKLVPVFNETDVEKYFQHFEKIASNLKWPLESWTTLIQTALRGKAQEVYASLSIEDCADYELVKANVLRSYEMVPEAYRQRFRNCRKDERQTYVEFFRQMETHFDRWNVAKGVDSDYG